MSNKPNKPENDEWHEFGEKACQAAEQLSKTDQLRWAHEDHKAKASAPTVTVRCWCDHITEFANERVATFLVHPTVKSPVCGGIIELRFKYEEAYVAYRPGRDYYIHIQEAFD